MATTEQPTTPALVAIAADLWTTPDGAVSIAIGHDGRYDVSTTEDGWTASVRTLTLAVQVTSWQLATDAATDAFMNDWQARHPLPDGLTYGFAGCGCLHPDKDKTAPTVRDLHGEIVGRHCPDCHRVF